MQNIKKSALSKKFKKTFEFFSNISKITSPLKIILIPTWPLDTKIMLYLVVRNCNRMYDLVYFSLTTFSHVLFVVFCFVCCFLFNTRQLVTSAPFLFV